MSDTLAPETPTLTNSSAQDQVYTERDLWYFRTSQGQEIGPFRYRSEAETGLQRFMSQLQHRLHR